MSLLNTKKTTGNAYRGSKYEKVFCIPLSLFPTRIDWNSLIARFASMPQFEGVISSYPISVVETDSLLKTFSLASSFYLDLLCPQLWLSGNKKAICLKGLGNEKFYLFIYLIKPAGRGGLSMHVFAVKQLHQKYFSLEKTDEDIWILP